MSLTRDFTATTFVVWQAKTLLHKHKKLGLWLPCGGHIDPHELPDEAAVREVYEESGVSVKLVGEKALAIAKPRQLLRPRGIQLEQIERNHEHIDLMYFAKPLEPYNGELLPEPSLGWYSQTDLLKMNLTEEVRQWTALALKELA